MLAVKDYRSCQIRKVTVTPSRQAVMDVFLKGEGRKNAAIAPSPDNSRRASSRISDGGENPQQRGRSASPSQKPWQNTNVPLVSLANFESINKGQDAINSPRSVGLCNEYGIKVAELVPRTLNQFRAPGVPVNIAQIRFDHYETRRAEKVSLLKEEREHRIKSVAAMKQQEQNAAVAAAERNNQTQSAAASPQHGAAGDGPPKKEVGRSHRSEAADDSEQQQQGAQNGEPNDQPVLGLLSEYTKELIVQGKTGASGDNKENHNSSKHQAGKTPQQDMPRLNNNHAPNANSRSSTPRGAHTPRSTTGTVSAVSVSSNVNQHKVPAAFRRLDSATVPDDVRAARSDMLMERENRRRLVYERAQKVKEERQCDSLLRQLDNQRRSEHHRHLFEDDRRTKLEAQRLYREDLTGAIQQKKRQEEYLARQDVKRMAQIRSSSARPADKYQVQLAKSMYMTPRQRRERSRSVGPAGTMESHSRVDSGRGAATPRTPR